MDASNRAEKRRMRLALVWPFLIAGTVCALSSASKLAAPDVEMDLPIDKVAHFLVFGLLATAIIRIPYIHAKKWWGALITVAIVTIYAAGDEYHQSFTPGRQVEIDDWIADTLGAILATSLYCAWSGYRSILEWKPRKLKNIIAKSADTSGE